MKNTKSKRDTDRICYGSAGGKADIRQIINHKLFSFLSEHIQLVGNFLKVSVMLGWKQSVSISMRWQKPSLDSEVRESFTEGMTLTFKYTWEEDK
jgi:hypothetical protein